jgi:hypothetical protein
MGNHPWEESEIKTSGCMMRATHRGDQYYDVQSGLLKLSG